jgi:hypothetical protein
MMSKELLEALTDVLDDLKLRKNLSEDDALNISHSVLMRAEKAVKNYLAQPEQSKQEPVAWMWTRNYEGGGYTNKIFQMKCEAEEYAQDSESLKYPDLVRPLYLDENQGGNNDR